MKTQTDHIDEVVLEYIDPGTSLDGLTSGERESAYARICAGAYDE